MKRSKKKSKAPRSKRSKKIQKRTKEDTLFNKFIRTQRKQKSKELIQLAPVRFLPIRPGQTRYSRHRLAPEYNIALRPQSVETQKQLDSVGLSLVWRDDSSRLRKSQVIYNITNQKKEPKEFLCNATASAEAIRTIFRQVCPFELVRHIPVSIDEEPEGAQLRRTESFEPESNSVQTIAEQTASLDTNHMLDTVNFQQVDNLFLFTVIVEAGVYQSLGHSMGAVFVQKSKTVFLLNTAQEPLFKEQLRNLVRLYIVEAFMEDQEVIVCPDDLNLPPINVQQSCDNLSEGLGLCQLFAVLFPQLCAKETCFEVYMMPILSMSPNVIIKEKLASAYVKYNRLSVAQINDLRRELSFL